MPAVGTFTGFGVAPTVVDAACDDLRTIRVQMSELMRNDAQVTTLANYTLTAFGAAAASTIMLAVLQGGNPTVVVLRTSSDLTPGVGADYYTIQVENLVDLALNPVGIPDTAELRPAAAPDLTVVPPTVQNDGGHAVAFTLDPGVTGDYNVFVGPLGTDEDPQCISGIEGQGSIISLIDGIGTAYTPILPVSVSGPYAFTFVRVSGQDTETFMTDVLLTVTPRDFKSCAISMRRYLTPWLGDGIRSTDRAPMPQV